MMKTAEKTLYRAILRARMALMQFEQEERGDAVQTIVVIGIGVILAALLYKLLVGDGIDDPANAQGNEGVVGKIFKNITDKIDTVFGKSK